MPRVAVPPRAARACAALAVSAALAAPPGARAARAQPATPATPRPDGRPAGGRARGPTLDNPALLSQIERSYVAGLSGVAGNLDSLIFEGNVAPHFVLLRSAPLRLTGVLTPKVLLRMRTDASNPVRAPSYLPRVAVFRFLGPRASLDSGYRFVSLTLSHHSNGQEGPFRLPDGRVNDRDGNFATNFVELGYQQGPRAFRRPGVRFTNSRVSYEYHPPGWADAALRGVYARHRLHASAALTTTRFAVSTFDVTYRADRQLGSDTFARRFDLWYALSTPPLFGGTISGFLNAYTGADYYNARFAGPRLGFVRVGLSTNPARDAAPPAALPDSARARRAPTVMAPH
jgi:hypothetical protein